MNIQTRLHQEFAVFHQPKILGTSKNKQYSKKEATSNQVFQQNQNMNKRVKAQNFKQAKSKPPTPITHRNLKYNSNKENISQNIPPLFIVNEQELQMEQQQQPRKQKQLKNNIHQNQSSYEQKVARNSKKTKDASQSSIQNSTSQESRPNSVFTKPFSNSQEFMFHSYQSDAKDCKVFEMGKNLQQQRKDIKGIKNQQLYSSFDLSKILTNKNQNTLCSGSSNKDQIRKSLSSNDVPLQHKQDLCRKRMSMEIHIDQVNAIQNDSDPQECTSLQQLITPKFAIPEMNSLSFASKVQAEEINKIDLDPCQKIIKQQIENKNDLKMNYHSNINSIDNDTKRTTKQLDEINSIVDKTNSNFSQNLPKKSILDSPKEEQILNQSENKKQIDPSPSIDLINQKIQKNSYLLSDIQLIESQIRNDIKNLDNEINSCSISNKDEYSLEETQLNQSINKSELSKIFEDLEGRVDALNLRLKNPLQKQI